MAFVVLAGLPVPAGEVTRVLAESSSVSPDSSGLSFGSVHRGSLYSNPSNVYVMSPGFDRISSQSW
jgi:hypothetical protein